MRSYRDVLYTDYSSHFGEAKAFDEGRSHFPLYDQVYAAFDVPRHARILDAGCGKGEWLGWLKARGYSELVGVDGSASDLGIAAQWLGSATMIHADLMQHLESTTAAYDVVHAKDVIEHLTKDEVIRFLFAARQSLKPGGQLWLQTFNAQAPLAAATRYGDFTHEGGLTPQSLSQCLRACGFKSVRVRGVHYCSSSIGGRIRRLLSLPVHAMAGLILRLRHGSGGGGDTEVERFSALPDMLAVAKVE
jgi:cyclopropane fatty-acyl-phospholipid synthase-like methyltransferase